MQSGAPVMPPEAYTFVSFVFDVLVRGKHTCIVWIKNSTKIFKGRQGHAILGAVLGGKNKEPRLRVIQCKRRNTETDDF